MFGVFIEAAVTQMAHKRIKKLNLHSMSPLMFLIYFDYNRLLVLLSLFSWL